MTKAKEPPVWLLLAAQVLIPAVVFIGSAAVVYSQVSDLKQSAQKTLENVQSMSERLVRVETKVKFLYDERKGN